MKRRMIIRLLPLEERPALASLFGAYAKEMGQHLSGASPADGAAMLRLLAADGRAEVLGAFVENQPAGFAVFFDLPEIVFARRCGALDDLFVGAAWRRQGLARAMIDHLAGLGRGRGWSHLRWIVPEADQAAIALYDRIASQADWRSYVLRLQPDVSL